MDRQGQTQANIAVGEVGIDLLDPDNFALDVLGDIMNGFGGRLFDELRSREVLQCFCSGQLCPYASQSFCEARSSEFMCPMFIARLQTNNGYYKLPHCSLGGWFVHT